jgi:hypothetical protein
MKPFTQIAFPSGPVFEIPTAVIAKNRASTMRELYSDEFATEESAMEDTVELFKASDYDIEDWARNNMNWSTDLEPHARLVRFTPPALDHVNDAEWVFKDIPGMVGELDAETIMRQPVEMVLSTMAASQQLCNVTVLNDPNGKPHAAMALIIGNEHVIGAYVQAMQMVGDAITTSDQKSLPN